MKVKNPARFKQIRDTILATTPAGFCGCVAALANFDYSARLPQIKLPTLVVWGAEDPGTPPEGNRRIVSLIPGARGEEIPDVQPLPQRRDARSLQPHHDGLACGAATLERNPLHDRCASFDFAQDEGHSLWHKERSSP